jgi:hypothetical protein
MGLDRPDAEEQTLAWFRWLRRASCPEFAGHDPSVDPLTFRGLIPERLAGIRVERELFQE